jgi:hypothetical protein
MALLVRTEAKYWNGNVNAPEPHGFSDDLAAMVREAGRPLIEVGAYLEQQSSALRVALEPFASGVLKSWLREQGEYMTGVAASIGPVLTAFAEPSRILSSLKLNCW